MTRGLRRVRSECGATSDGRARETRDEREREKRKFGELATGVEVDGREATSNIEHSACRVYAGKATPQCRGRLTTPWDLRRWGTELGGGGNVEDLWEFAELSIWYRRGKGPYGQRPAPVLP